METQNLMSREIIKQEPDCEATRDSDHEFSDPVQEIKQEHDSEAAASIPAPITTIKLEPDDDDYTLSNEDNEEDQHMAPVMKRARISSTSPTHSNEESVLYCEKCQMKYEGHCPEHGHSIYADNAEISQGGGRNDLSTRAGVDDRHGQETHGEYEGQHSSDQTIPNIEHQQKTNDDRYVGPGRLDNFLGVVYKPDSDNVNKSVNSDGDRNVRLMVVGNDVESDMAEDKSTVHVGSQDKEEDNAEAHIVDVGTLENGSGFLVPDKMFSDCEMTGQFSEPGGSARSKINWNSKKYRKMLNSNRRFKCELCGVGFHRGSDLSKHNRTHTGEKPYKCDICGTGFAQSSPLKTHKRIHTGEKPYKCDVCGVGFYNGSHLKTHSRIHTGEKPYKCDVCGVGFSDCSHLRTHNRIHTGEKPYKCDVCEVRFAQCSDLRRHVRIHTGEKPYKCEFCGVGFAQSSPLVKHIRIHTGEKPYKCEVCGAGFTGCSDLKQHIRTHTGEKPYKCDICGVGFVGGSVLKKHKRTHTREKPHKCDVCGVGFTRGNDLKSHKRVHAVEVQ